jgi:hypothetical protein
MIVSLKARNIPRNKVGDPYFVHGKGTRLYDEFSPDEVCELVNRCLYQLEYQSRAHQKRNAERSALEAPVKEVFRTLYPKQSYAKATDEQLAKCIQEVKTRQV